MFKIGGCCILAVLMLVACTRTRPPHDTPVDSALPSKVSTPALDSRKPKKSGPSAQHVQRIHQQLFQVAKEYFHGQEYSRAISELRRLLALKPESSMEHEGRWLLAESYHQVGELQSASEEYRRLASAREGHRFQQGAASKYEEVQRFLERGTQPPQDIQAIRLTLGQLPASEGFDQGIRRMREDGITSLVIDLGCRRTSPEKNNQAMSHYPRDFSELQSLLRSFADRSHQQDLQVYVGVNLRCAGYWDWAKTRRWQDRTYDVDSQRLEANGYFDIFHPNYQKYLYTFFMKLSGVGINGVLILSDYPLGIHDGVSPMGLARFQESFGLALVPSQVFASTLDSRLEGSHRRGAALKRAPASGEFWGWAGWKARSRLDLAEKLVRHVRQGRPEVQFGLELHPHGLTDPVGALVDYAEDAMEAVQRPFSFFYVRPEIDRRSSHDQAMAIEKLRRISTKAILNRLLPVVDDPGRVWVSVPSQGHKRIIPDARQPGFFPLQEFPVGIGVVHDLRAFS